METATPVINGIEKFFSKSWEKRLHFIVELMRDLSRQTEPMKMVELYGERMKKIVGYDHSVSLSRRDLVEPYYRITRSSRWQEAINPWNGKDRLPLMKGGLFAELIYKEEPTIIDDLQVDPSDPAASYFEGMRSLFAIPMYDNGKSLNMVVTMSRHPDYYPRQYAPEFTWLSNLFGRATYNLVLSDEVQRAYKLVDRELTEVADIQKSLLPAKLPEIPGLELAVHYSTSQRAGGDYYDFFPLPDGKWGILIADVSGHGTPAAVIMAVTHSIAHTFPGTPKKPSELLDFINRNLAARYTHNNGTFVTGFYGIYDPKTRELQYACAGHGPPRIKTVAGSIRSLDRCRNLPLGIDPTEQYENRADHFQPGDTVVFYTDGITETRNASGELFGTGRLDKVLAGCSCKADDLIQQTLAAVNQFGEYLPAADDRTLLIARVQ